MKQIPANYEDLPKGFPGFCVYDVHTEYIIVINKNMSKEEQKNFYTKEKEKINKGLYVEEVIRSAF